jgi:hypothetical protein
MSAAAILRYDATDRLIQHGDSTMPDTQVPPAAPGAPTAAPAIPAAPKLNIHWGLYAAVVVLIAVLLIRCRPTCPWPVSACWQSLHSRSWCGLPRR